MNNAFNVYLLKIGFWSNGITRGLWLKASREGLQARNLSFNAKLLKLVNKGLI